MKLREAIAKILDQRKSKENSIIKLRAQREDRNKSIIKLREQRESRDNSIMKLKGTIAKIIDQRKSKENSIIKLKETIAKLREQREERENTIIKLRVQREDRNKSIIKLREQIQDRNNSIIKLRAQRDNLQEKLKVTRENNQKSITNLKEQKDNLLEKLKVTRENNQKSITKLKEQKDNLQEKLKITRENYQKSITKLRDQREYRDNSIVKLREQKDNVIKQKNKILNSLSIVKNRYESTKEEFKKTNNKLSEIIGESIIKRDVNHLALEISKNFTSLNKFGMYRECIRNASGYIIENDNSDLISIDAAKISMGIINLNNGLNYGAYSYFKAVKNKELLYKSVPTEYLFSLAIQGIKFFENKYFSSEERELYLSLIEKKNFGFNLIKIYSSHKEIESNKKMEEIKRILPTEKDIISDNFDPDTFKWINYYCFQRPRYLKEFQLNSNTEKLINIGVMDYKMIDLKFCSGNLGDYVQTLASVLAWRKGLGADFSDSSELGKNLNKIFKDINCERNLDNNIDNKLLNPIVIDRDSANWQNLYKEKTWFICNGWYHHSPYGVDEEFGFPENIIPIFVSFHMNKSNQIRPDLINYLKKNSPIGCRDWTTVFMLKSQGVDAFFSGCLTMTLGDLYPNFKISEGNREAYVEALGDNGQINSNSSFCQVGDEVKSMRIEDGVIDAYNMLKKYLEFDKIFTSRLHCYLPCTSIGLEVEFKPKNYSDQRYPGLFPLSKEEFNNIRNKLRDRLSLTVDFIAKNNPSRSNFSEFWNNLWQEEVKEANEYFDSFKKSKIKKTTINVEKAIKDLKDGVLKSPEKDVDKNNQIHIAFGFDQNLLEQFEVTLSSILDKTNRDLKCYVLGRNLGNQWIEYIIQKYSSVQFEFYDMTVINYGEKVKTLAHITLSTMDRIFLPNLINIPKLIYLDTDLIVRKDICKLWNYDIEKYFMAGVSSRFDGWRDIMTNVLRASRLLSPNDANALRSYCFKRFPNAIGRNFNAGVLLMNLKKMRQESFTEDAPTFIENYYLNDQDVLALFSNGEVLELDIKYNLVPSQSYLEDPSIVHWAGPRKPWKKEIFVQFQKEYNAIKKKSSL